MDPTFLIILVVGLGALLFLNWRTRKQQQAKLSFRDDLTEGQQVQTIGGLIGTVVAVEGETVTLESGPGTQLKFVKAALARLIEDEDAVDDDGEDEDALAESDDEHVSETSSTTDEPRNAAFETRDELKDMRRDDRI
ncbi:preprotein translocase subunit YajC [Ruania halotolerans]|uniref:preprotein translocase subunit YajC n=1 Tax=Ruania halotolerans TaxID=2897773 RepID=UPI001E5AE27E|nr:preprotein translocase subunit YajC [Ruania halotolerans]UFU04764.1 preprotein translocase subunit YajC [Ruania halotolerans]